MAFLDWTKERSGAKPPEPKADVAKSPSARDYFSQQEAQEKANQKPLTPEIKAQADRVMATVDKSTWSLQAHSPEGGSTGTPMRQSQLNQDRTAPALSPTTDQVGKVAEPLAQAANEKANQVAQNAPDKTRTQSRDRGGWER